MQVTSIAGKFFGCPLLPYILLAVLLVVGWATLLRGRDSSQQGRLFKALYLVGISSYLVNVVCMVANGLSVLEVLPLHVCYIGLFLSYPTLSFQNTLASEYVTYVASLGCIAALIFPSADYIDASNLLSPLTVSFALLHIVVLMFPFSTFLLGQRREPPTVKMAIRLTLLMLGLALVMHVANTLLNGAFGLHADYFFTIREYATPTNPVFALFAYLIPADYWYTVFAFPLIYAYMALWRLMIAVRDSQIRIEPTELRDLRLESCAANEDRAMQGAEVLHVLSKSTI